VEHRIRVAALVVHGDRLLLSRHEHPAYGTWWTPPGGGLEDGETIPACAEREAGEETGLTVAAGEIASIGQFIEPSRNRHTLELFVLARVTAGLDDPAAVIAPRGERHVHEARFVSRAEAAALRVLPEVFADAFWDDLTAGFARTRYLGLSRPGG
jgi:8-oxo-dGTP diphosphatase